MAVILTKPIWFFRVGKRLPGAVFERLQSGNCCLIGQIAQSMATMFAAHILEIDELTAGLAAEQLHPLNFPLSTPEKRPFFSPVPATRGARSSFFAVAA
jgi:hypothetical protein